MTLSEFQKAEGLNLTQLAARLGLPVPTVHAYLSGFRRPTWRQLDKILAATNGQVTAADFHRPQPQSAA